MVKNPPAMLEPQEMWGPSLGQEDLLEEGMATHSSILAWKIPWTGQPGKLWSMGSHSQIPLKWLSTHTCTLHHIHKTQAGKVIVYMYV